MPVAAKLSRKDRSVLEGSIRALEKVESELQRRTSLSEPTWYGMPDLLCPQGYKFGEWDKASARIKRVRMAHPESDQDYKKRQNEALFRFVTTKLYITKDGRDIPIIVVPKMLKFVADVFFKRVNKVILWKGRGCLTPENKILTQRGLIAISEVTTNDYVMNCNGKLVPVFDVVPRDYKGRIVRLKVNGNGQKLGFTPDHLILAMRQKQCWNKKLSNGGKTVCTEQCARSCKNRLWESYKEEWIEAENLKPGDLVFIPRPVTSPEIGELSFHGAPNQHWNGTIRTEMSPEFFRLMGYYLAEGSSSKKQQRIRMSFESGKDDAIIEDAKQLVSSLFGLTAGIERSGKKVDVRICSAGLVKFVAQFGKRHTKGADLEFLRTASDACLLQLIIGMLRGDGHWDGTSIRVSWCSSRNAATFMYACWRLGFVPSYRMTKAQCRVGRLVNHSGPQFYLQLSGEPGRKLASLTWKIEHKQLKYKPMNSQRRWASCDKLFSRIDQVQFEQYEGQVWDLEIPDGSSFSLPYLVAHNCGGSMCAAVLIWICLVYHKMSFVDMAGALEQAKIVYDYVTQFWACIPGLQKNLVVGDPLISATKLATGAHLRCITPESMVLTDDGFKQIQNIRPGDMVFDGAGRMSAVKKVMVRWHDGDVVKLSPTGFGPGVRLTVDHRVASLNGLKSKGRDRIGGNNGWTESGTLAKGDRLVVPIFETNPGKKELSLVDFPRGKRREQSLVIDEDVMRFLGYWAADGTSYDRWISISFSKSQEAWVRNCCSIVRKCFKRSPTILRRENVDIVHFSFKGLASWLRANCGKSVTKRLSWDVLMRSSDSELLEFLVGAIRGDGSFGEQVSKTGVKRAVSFTSVSPVFSEQVFLIGARLGLFPSLLLHKARKAVFGGKEYEGKPQYGVRFTGNGADRLADAAGFKWRARKSKSFQSGSMIGGWIERPVRKVSVEPYGGPVYDLEIDGHPSFMLPWVLAHNCITTTEKQARGKHVPGLTLDESCQRDGGSDDSFKAAMNITMSEPEHIIVMLSTFHVPVGMFQQYWDFAEERGFTRYKWTVYDVMSLCEEGAEFITEDDPEALGFCRTSCPLTEQVEVKGEDGSVIGTAYKGCDGKARKGSGFLGRENVINAKLMNTGSEIFDVEFACERPRFSGPIYGLESIERAVVEEIEDPNPEQGRLCAGIDWGTIEGALVLLKDCGDFLGVVASRLISARVASDFAEILYEWQDEYGHLEVFADASHPFENNELDDMGFDVTAVDFGVLKDDGVANLLRMFVHAKVKIIEKGNDRLIQQLKHFHRDQKTGKIVKKDDHGPDALMCASVTFDFRELWPELLTIRGREENKSQRRNLDEKGVDKDTSVLLF